MTDFSPATLAKAVHDTFDAAQAAIPEGHTKAVIFNVAGTKANGIDASATILVRDAEGNWGVVGGGGYDTKSGAYGQFQVFWSGK